MYKVPVAACLAIRLGRILQSEIFFFVKLVAMAIYFGLPFTSPVQWDSKWRHMSNLNAYITGHIRDTKLTMPLVKEDGNCAKLLPVCLFSPFRPA